MFAPFDTTATVHQPITTATIRRAMPEHTVTNSHTPLPHTHKTTSPNLLVSLLHLDCIDEHPLQPNP